MQGLRVLSSISRRGTEFEYINAAGDVLPSLVHAGLRDKMCLGSESNGAPN